MQLTPKQKEVLNFIVGFKGQKGYGPSQREIAEHFGFKSLGTVQNYIVRMQKQGVLEKAWNAKRGIQVSSDFDFSPQPQNTKQPKGASASEHRSSSTRPFSSALPIQEYQPEAVSLPLVGKVAAGQPIEAIEHHNMIDVPASMIRRGEHFVLKVTGNSMIEEGILNGDFVVIKKQPSASNGQTVVALIGNEATIKKFYRYGERVELHPANPSYDPLIIESLVEIPDFQIEGVLVGVIRSLN